MKKFLIGASVAALMSATAAAEGRLVIASNAADIGPRTAFETIVASFRAANPDIDVEFNITEAEAYKTEVRNFLVADQGPDVGYWFAGNRMAGFVEGGLFTDISDVWAENDLERALASTMPSVTFDGAQYGLPYTYYQWGVYYRPDVYEAAGVSVPTTYDEMIAGCEAMAAQGKSMFTIGTLYKWTAAGWFDYVNMRTNGLAFHTDLMLGKVDWTDDRVRATMDNWAKAVDAGCYNEGHQNLSWQEGQAPLVNGDAGSYLMGNFLISNVPEETAAAMDYYQFPDIDPSIPRGEDAPTDLLFIPSNAQNVDNAKKFLAYVAQPENQVIINEALAQLPTHADAPAPTDRFLAKGMEVLSNSVTAQFFDRDGNPEFAGPAMALLVEFMLDPSEVEGILEDIEAIREEVHGAL